MPASGTKTKLKQLFYYVILLPWFLPIAVMGATQFEEPVTASDCYVLWQLHLVAAERFSDKGNKELRDYHLAQAKEMGELALKLFEVEKEELKRKYPVPPRTEPDIERGTFNNHIDY